MGVAWLNCLPVILAPILTTFTRPTSARSPYGNAKCSLNLPPILKQIPRRDLAPRLQFCYPDHSENRGDRLARSLFEARWTPLLPLGVRFILKDGNEN